MPRIFKQICLNWWRISCLKPTENPSVETENQFSITTDPAEALVKRIQAKLSKNDLKGTIKVLGRQFYFVATLPLLNDPTKKKQQRIKLSASTTNTAAFKAVEIECLDLARKVTSGSFRWPTCGAGEIEAPTNITVAEFRQAAEALFREIYREKDSERATRAWGRKWKPALNKLPSSGRSELTVESLTRLIKELPLASAARRDQGSILIRTSARLGWDVTELKTLIGGYGAKALTKRDIPSDEEIEVLFDKIKLPHWKFVFAACAIFGLRPHEVSDFSFRPEHGWIDIGEETKTGGRVVKAIPLKWIEKFGLMELPRPETEKYQISKACGDALERDGIRLRLYNLRHAFAIRCFTLGITADHGAALMGHTLAVHENTYRKWITKDRVMKALEFLD